MSLYLSYLSAIAAEPPLAGVTTAYYHNSHADVILGRFVEGYALNGQGDFPKAKLASLYIDQFPENDKGRQIAERHKIPLLPNIRQALTLGGERLAVDGVLLIAEHGKYPESDTGSVIYPKRAMFAEIARVCAQSHRAAPVFIDKHLADNWSDAKWIYDEAQRQKIPLMAGSSLPVLWRHPPVDTTRDKPLKQIVALSYHRLDSYGFHALEMLQCLAERRAGGETGIKQVRTLKDAAVWQAIDVGMIDAKLFTEVLTRHKDRPLPTDKKLSELVEHPVLFVIDYRDGLQAFVLTVENIYIDWTAAWQYADGSIASAAFCTQEERPLMHFAVLLQQMEPFWPSGEPVWPVERTLLTTGLLDALLISHRDGGRVVETPHLDMKYQASWNWQQPPPPPPGRPLNDQ